MTDREPERSDFWAFLTTILGVVTAVAALIVAVGGAVAAIGGAVAAFKDGGASNSGGAQTPTLEDWDRKAGKGSRHHRRDLSKACRTLYDEIADIGRPTARRTRRIAS